MLFITSEVHLSHASVTRRKARAATASYRRRTVDVARSTRDTVLSSLHDLHGGPALETQTQNQSWATFFSRLQQWYQCHEHFEIPAGYSDLALWAEEQRQAFSAGRLETNEYLALQRIGFLSECRAWDQWFGNLERLIEMAPRLDAENYTAIIIKLGKLDLALMIWTLIEYERFVQGELGLVRETAMKRVPLPWSSVDKSASWASRYVQLCGFFRRHGHSKVSSENASDDFVNWVKLQRSQRRTSKCTSHRWALLNLLDFSWNLLEERWNGRLAELRQFKAKYGHCPVGSDKRNPEWEALSRWVVTQRSARSRGTLSKERIAALTKLGFPWDEREVVWESMFQQYIACGEVEGPCDSSRLARWVAAQRLQHRRGVLSAERERRLTEAGFVWDLWERKYRELAEFHERFGHVIVPAEYDSGRLYSFVRNQRTKFRQGKLSEEHRQLMMRVGALLPVGSGAVSDLRSEC